jgi:hypothetical protein
MRLAQPIAGMAASSLARSATRHLVSVGSKLFSDSRRGHLFTVARRTKPLPQAVSWRASTARTIQSWSRYSLETNPRHKLRACIGPVKQYGVVAFNHTKLCRAAHSTGRIYTDAEAGDDCLALTGARVRLLRTLERTTASKARTAMCRARITSSLARLWRLTNAHAIPRLADDG